MQKYKLKANKRSVLGRKVKNLRQEGKLPGNIYGRKVKSQAVEVDLKEFKKIYDQAGETSIVDLNLSDKDSRSILIHNVQMDYLTQTPLHADFYQVDLKQKIKSVIPLKLEGVSPAVEQKKGMILQTLNEVEVEALPTDLPESLTIDISTLTEVDQELKVVDLKHSPAVVILTDGQLQVVKVGELVSKEAEQLAKEEEEAAAAAKAETAKTGAVAGEEVKEEIKEDEGVKKEEAKPAEKQVTKDKEKA